MVRQGACTHGVLFDLLIVDACDFDQLELYDWRVI